MVKAKSETKDKDEHLCDKCQLDCKIVSIGKVTWCPRFRPLKTEK